jgi:hypothetical protein
MLAPNGQSGDVPVSNVQAAQQAGFKVAVSMKSPDGQAGYIPADRVHDAAAAGFKMIPIDAPDAAKASYWDALTNPVGAGGRQQGVLGGALQMGGQAIKTMAQPLAHPIDTLEGLYNTARHPINTAEGITNQVKADYAQGGVPLAAENLGGQLLGGIESGELVAPLVNTAAGAVGRVAEKMGLPQWGYESSLKLPTTTKISQADRENLVQTGLQNNIPVSKGGFNNLRNLIQDYDAKRQAVIDTDPTQPISLVPALRNLDQLRSRFANQVTPQPDLAEIDQVQQNFLNNPKVQPQGMGPGPATVSAADAQAIKSGTYRALGNKSYGEVKGASIEAQKSLAAAFKDELANAFPELQNINGPESKLLDLEPYIERAINRNGNHQLIGIGTPIAAGAGAAVTGSGEVGGVIGAIKMVVDNPVVKSRLAIALSKAAKIPLGRASARVDAYSSALGSASAVGQQSSDDQTATQRF